MCYNKSMKTQEINPFVRQALSSRLTKQNQTDTFNRIRSVDCRFFYISDGTGQMRFADTAYPLRAGTVVLFRAGTEYVWEPDEFVDYYAINFDYTQSFSHISTPFHPIYADRFSEADIIESPVFEDEPLLEAPLVLPFAPEFELKIRAILTESLIGNEYSAALTSGLLKQIIVEALRKKRTAATARPPKSVSAIKQVIEYVSKHYMEELTYERLAELFHFNPSYLNRIFKAHTGKTLHEFLIHYRLQSAMELLRSQSLSVKEVAALCGFPDPYHFTKAFKKHTGVPPSKYKHQ